MSSHPLIHSPNDHSGWGWVEAAVGSWELYPSLLGWQELEPPPGCLPGSTLAGRWGQKLEAALEPR